MKAPSIDDLYLHVSLSSLVSAGRRWAWTATTVDREDDANPSSVWIHDRDRGTRRLSADGHGPVWSHDGEQLAFVRSIDGAPQIFVHRIGDDEPRQVTHLASGITSIEHWDARSNRFLVRIRLPADRPSKEPRRVSYLPYKRDGSGVIAGETVQLHAVDGHTGEAWRLVREDGDVIEAKASPDGAVVAFVKRRTGTQRHRMDIWLQRGNDVPRQLATGLVSISGLNWSPDGRKLAVAASATEGDSVTGLYVVDADTGHAQPLGLEMAMPGSIAWNERSDRLVVTDAWRGLQRIVRVSLDGTTEVLWQDGGRQVMELAMADGAIGFLASGLDDGVEFWTCDVEGRQPTRLTSFNAWRRDRPPLQARLRSFTVPDGQQGEETVQGWLLTPPTQGPFPLLLDMHGGPHTTVAFELERYVHWPVLLDRGWAILALNAVGSSSYGSEFAHRIRGRWGELDLPQWQAAAKQLQDEGTASGQVACFGHSYGGYLSAWALSHGMPLIAGVVSAGVMNLESHFGTSDSGYYVGPYAMDGELASARGRYRELSPVSHAEHIRAPVLFLQGEDDQRCPVGQTEELFAALIRHGLAKTEMLLFPGGSHHVSTTGRPSHRAAYYDALVSWLENARERDSGHQLAGVPQETVG